MKKSFFKGIELEVFPGVYEPAEDSFLLAEQLLKENISGKKVLDLCCGSGIQSVIASSKKAFVVSADKNPLALKNTLLNAEKNHVSENISLVQSDLFLSMKSKFDLVLMNPPYVPAEKIIDERVDALNNGRQFIDRLLNGLDSFLNENGEALIIQSSLNGLQETIDAAEKNGFQTEIVSGKKLFFEELFLIRFSRSKSN